MARRHHPLGSTRRPIFTRRLGSFVAAATMFAVSAQASSETCYQIHPDSEIEPPVATQTVEPEYPALARKARLQGVVILQTTVRSDGTVGRVEVLKGLPMGLSEQAIAAVRQRRFEPATRNGEPICVHLNQTVEFQLNEQTMFGGRVQIPASPGVRFPGSYPTVFDSPVPQPSRLSVAFGTLTMIALQMLAFVLWIVVLILALRLLIWALHRLGFAGALGRFGFAVQRAYREAENRADDDHS